MGKKNTKTVVNVERQKIKNLVAGLELSEDLILRTTGNVIRNNTGDGIGYKLNDIDDDVPGKAMYKLLVRDGELEVEVRERVVREYIYKPTEIYKDHFTRTTKGVKLKTNMLALAKTLYLDRLIAEWKDNEKES